MGGRSDGQQVYDHHFVPADQFVLDERAVVRRPVPVEKCVFGRGAVPVPLDAFPEARYLVVKLVVVLEILTGGQQTLGKKGCFHEIATILITAEDGHGLTGAAVEKVRPNAVEAV